MRRIFFRCGMLCMLASSMMFTSCLQEEDIVEMVEDKYNHDFKETFGKVDPNHTWSTASISNVTANISGREGNYTLKLYTSNPRLTTKQAYLLAKYDIKGGETIDYQFDMPASLKYVYAALVDDKGYRMVKSAQLMNGKVNFDFSTGGKARATSDDVVTFSETENYYYFGDEDFVTPLSCMPEDSTYIQRVFEHKTGTTLHRSFLYESTGNSFTIYPYYNVTSNAGFELGIYYYPSSGGKIEVPIWNRSTVEFHTKENTWENIGNNFATNKVTTEKWNYQEYYHNESSQNTYLRMKGITINIEKGTQFGFYITASNNSGKRYSESYLNPSTYITYAGNYVTSEDKKTTYTQDFGATYHKHNTNGECEFYLTFEDGIDFDYNDLIVKIGDVVNPETGKVPPLSEHENVLLIVDREEEEDVNMSYIVAYEDLGVNDFDFNDVVLGIDYISTNQANKKATFKLMAAGGTLPVSVAYNTTTLWEEIHQAFGVSSNTPVNVKGNTKEKGHISKEIAVEDNFTILADASKLKITVSKNGIDVENISIPNPDETGGTPQAILVASPTWEWPTEGQLITSHPKYGKDFAQWITETTFTNWWDNKYTWSSEENPGGGDNTGGDSGEGGETPDYGTPIYSSTETIDNECTFNGNNLSIPDALFQTYKETGCTLTFIAPNNSYIKLFAGDYHPTNNNYITILDNIDNGHTIPYIVNITTDQMQQFEELYPNKDKIITLQVGANSITEIYIK